MSPCPARLQKRRGEGERVIDKRVRAKNHNHWNSSSFSLRVLTLDCHDDLGRHGLGAHVVLGFAAVPGLVVVRGRDEVVHVAGLPSRGGVGEVDADPVLEPDDLGQRVAPVGDADQGDGLAQANRLALDVPLDLGRTGGILRKKKEQINRLRKMETIRAKLGPEREGGAQEGLGKEKKWANHVVILLLLLLLLLRLGG